jgi:hypothetical protein
VPKVLRQAMPGEFASTVAKPRGIALGAFVGVAASFVTVLWPRHEWEFNTQSGIC